eukprot:GHVR01137657.1.p1 GENE.GHVR01137657.1~~GHVR01137657.1.p1  ORF type:complete len:143 (+),score=1.23 GHVR01137657.1:73-501(+)
MMLKFLLLLPALVYATRYCQYKSKDCTGVSFCHGCSSPSHSSQTGEEITTGWELKDGDVYEETYKGVDCPGSPIFSTPVLTGENIQLDTCYTADDYRSPHWIITYPVIAGYYGDKSVKFGNANSVGISMILLGLLLSLPFLK